MTTHTLKIAVAEFEAMAYDPGHRYELVDGELVDMDGKPRHGAVTGEIYLLLRGHIGHYNLPFDVGVNTGFQMDPFTLRFPDVHVTSWERMAAYDEGAPGWPAFAPDVAIEVVSDSNTPAELARKAEEYFANGTRAMWIADPGRRVVAIRRPGVSDHVFSNGDILSGEPEITDFSCLVADIFVVLDRNPGSNSEVN
ncbi:MAG: Uma2 family endonuclease [Dehalococcoidia bacterium]|nr:Uma2 family endonuclease [Dehalococcoidia bacterium]